MFGKIRSKMFPVRISEALEMLGKINPDAQTIRWYSTPIKQLIAREGDLNIIDITPEMLTRWHKFISSNSYSPWTVDSYTRAMKAAMNRLVDMKHLEESPAAHLRLRRLPRKEPKDIKEADIRKMIRYSQAIARDAAIVRILADTGCRVGELCSMLVSQTVIKEDGGRSIISSDKVHSTRFIFFGKKAAYALQLYIECRPHNAADELWLNRSNEPLSTNGVYQLLRRIARRAGVGRFNPHSFRHGFAKRMISEGAPAKVVQDLMGHQDVTTTLNLYVVYSDAELEKFHQEYSKDW